MLNGYFKVNDILFFDASFFRAEMIDLKNNSRGGTELYCDKLLHSLRTFKCDGIGLRRCCAKFLSVCFGGDI